jgi:hypothetical protein
MTKTFGFLAIAVLAMAAVTSGPADARARHRARAACVERPQTFSLRNFLLPGGPQPGPNGCSPAVHQYGKYIGQDPDPNIRFQLSRDPATGNPEFY